MTLPLTIQHSKEDRHLFVMPEAQLLGLITLEFDRLLEQQLKIVNDWINNKRCECSKNIHIQNREISLKCKHIKSKKGSDKIIIKTEARIEKMSSALTLRRYGGYKLATHFHGKVTE